MLRSTYELVLVGVCSFMIGLSLATLLMMRAERQEISVERSCQEYIEKSKNRAIKKDSLKHYLACVEANKEE